MNIDNIKKSQGSTAGNPVPAGNGKSLRLPSNAYPEMRGGMTAAAENERLLPPQAEIIHEDVLSLNQDDTDATDSDDRRKRDRRAGRRKIRIEYIPDKSRRHITFSKRKAGIMKKAYELSTLTGTQVLLLVASETGHVYTFATPKLQPLITKPDGKNLIQACLNTPDVVPMDSGNCILDMGAGDNESVTRQLPYLSEVASNVSPQFKGMYNSNSRKMSVSSASSVPIGPMGGYGAGYSGHQYGQYASGGQPISPNPARYISNSPNIPVNPYAQPYTVNNGNNNIHGYVMNNGNGYWVGQGNRLTGSPSVQSNKDEDL